MCSSCKTDQPLGEQEKQIHIYRALMRQEKVCSYQGTKILMKTGKKMGQIKEFLQGSSQDICLVENCGMDRRTYCPISGRDFRRCGILFPSNCKRQEKIEKAGRIMITFVGAGPGAEDLITVRGQRLLKEADIVIYAGSLVKPGIT